MLPARARCAGAVLLLMAACATPAPPPTEAAAPEVPLPPPALEPLTVSRPDDRPRPPGLRLLEEARFTLAVQDADLQTLLLGLGRDGPFNAVIDPDVTGRVTADFRNASMREILDEILAPRGYHYSVRGRFLRISASDVSTRIYRVDYPSYLRSGSSDLTISGAIASSPDVGAGGAPDGEDTSSTSIQTTQNVDFWAQLEAGLRVIVFGAPDAEPSDDAERNLVVARQSGLLTVTAEPEVLRNVEDFLDETSRSTHRQVMIDVRILEIDIGDDFEFGVD
jgi:MSHA biogenesis protein MshL